MGSPGAPRTATGVLERAITFGAAAALLVTSARSARRPDVPSCEEQVFRRVNGAPDHLTGPIWIIMQAGSLGAVPVTAAAVCRRRGVRPAVGVLAAGTGAWAAMKLVKPLVGRGRPSDLLDEVRVRGAAQRGLGYPSGHAAVAATLAVATARSPATCSMGVVAAGAVGMARLSVGAHLPLDVVGGLASGVLVGLVARSAGTAPR